MIDICHIIWKIELVLNECLFSKRHLIKSISKACIWKPIKLIFIYEKNNLNLDNCILFLWLSFEMSFFKIQIEKSDLLLKR